VAWFYSTNPDYMARVRANHFIELNTLGIVANRAAYAGGEDWLNQVVTYIDGTHDFAERFIKTHMPLIKWTKAQGTYLAWLDVGGVAERIGARAQAETAAKAEGRTVTPEMIVQRFFVKHAKVLINPGSSYGLGGANHMRMNLATSRKLVERALTNMATALKNT
jgi:cysteine-S-conjugate beta-lyase